MRKLVEYEVLAIDNRINYAFVDNPDALKNFYRIEIFFIYEVNSNIERGRREFISKDKKDILNQVKSFMLNETKGFEIVLLY